MRRAIPLLVLLLPVVCRAQILQHADRGPDDMVNVIDGVLTLFDAGEDGRWLNQVEIYAMAYGLGPRDELELHVLDPEGELLRTVAVPGAIIGDNEPDWHRVPIPPMQVPREFGIGLVGAFPPGGVNPYEWGAQDMFFRYLVASVQNPRGLRVGCYDLEASHSYTWTPGTEGVGLGTRDWMVRAYMAAAPEGDPDAADIVVPKEGDAYIDTVLSMDGDPLDIVTKGHGRVPREDADTVRLNAVWVPRLSVATVTLATGPTVEGTLVSMDETSVAVRTLAGSELSIPRADVRAVSFMEIEQPAIASQPQPEPVTEETVDAPRRWGTEQVLGEPDTDQRGDQPTAWAPREQDQGTEWLRLTYETAVDIAEVRVRETFNPGAVSKVVASSTYAER